MMLIAADINVEALAIFALVLGITLAITYWASKRTNDATSFWAAGRAISGPQNGFAIAGDYMSAASFLGIAGLIFLYGFDGFLYSVEAVQEDQPGDAQERRRAHVVAGDGEAVLRAADRPARGPEGGGVIGPLGRPVGDGQRDAED